MKGNLTRIFINHPKVGTLIVRKTRPGQRSKRFRLTNDFWYKLRFYEYPGMSGFHQCAVCGKMLLNPQSQMLHIGNGCESKNNKMKYEK